MPPGYRRRILIEPGAGLITAELEDDYHRMAVTLAHHDGIVTEVRSEMKRAPWTLCPGAQGKLAESFTGAPLAGFAKLGDKKQNCTHLYDLALFAAAHAYGAGPVEYDILVTDPAGGIRHASLKRDGAALLHWSLAGDLFTAPVALAGGRLAEISGWIAGLSDAEAEAARILRWAAILAFGRGMDIPAGSSATLFPAGTCYNFQPERAENSTRMPGADVDFSAAGLTPLSDRPPPASA